MRTLSHILITAGAGVGLQKRGATVHLKAFLLGSVLPDLPLVLLTVGYIAANAGVFTGGAATDGLMDDYHTLYFTNPLWIISHNLFHAPFVIAAIFLVGLRAERRGQGWGVALRWLALGFALHSTVDILTHHDDGPLLFFPFDWSIRFYSPVSYWDRSYHASAFTVFEYALDLVLIAFFAIRGARLWLARRP